MACLAQWTSVALLCALAAIGVHAVEQPSVYTVSEGDTLSEIAATQLGDEKLWVELAGFNDLGDPNEIREGQRLLVPTVAGMLLAAQETDRADERVQTLAAQVEELRQAVDAHTDQEAVDTLAAEVAVLAQGIRDLRAGLARDGLGLVPVYVSRFEDDQPGKLPAAWDFPSGGKWRIRRGDTHVLQQYDREHGNKGAVVGAPDMSNYTVQADIKTENSGDGGVFAYWQSHEQNYRLRTLDRLSHLELATRRPAGPGFKKLVLARISFPLKESRWYHFKLQVENLETCTYLRGKVWEKGRSEPPEWTIETADHAADRYTSGRAGVWAWRSGSSYRGSQFDNFAILKLPE